MSKPILEIQNISKKYRIQHERQSYLNLRDSLSGMFKGRAAHEEFFALQDVSFNVMPGDSIGIIGKNGAGKSTLLKILSKITPPTSGRIISRGRIASLLEVGTGFHGELTGRENIFLNGSILGMKWAEIKKNFDAIVDFSGVEKFLDTPLKHYSSGMQLRLAFAVAAFLENEILVIDEVLAVGDAEFQKKCLGKMELISKGEGRTILFVSHNLSQISSICQKGVLIEKGELILAADNISDVISSYTKFISGNTIIDVSNQNASIPDLIKIESIHVNGANNLREFDKIEIDLSFEILTIIEDFIIGFSISDSSQKPLIECRSTASYKSLVMEERKYCVQCVIPLRIRSGIYNLNFGMRCKKGQVLFMPNIAMIEILPARTDSNEWDNPSNGIIITDSKWSII